MYTDFGVDNSSHFPFREQTDTHKLTDKTDHPTQALARLPLSTDKMLLNSNG